ncbi:RimJ/RimL family protein N-acetyltransferase [Kibdelosporangium banguiense]|uniref:RimJ/RimL family protein N-acetyltransferase n=1 Tax=Kibdelosporangium banguiense TaxID=1365924 RepID=A0ABS4TTL4_9PSEU|nr:GNAT family N-acetyltransferase [Kibdelosporangium banguiense]MBP2327738.1 RimJ/RimL family protein N-acetyltransferase [Kibdelosporangium banguiense]
MTSLSADVIESDRLVLRKMRDTDREGLIEVFTDPEVRAYLGGPRPRSAVEQFLDQFGAAALPGGYIIADKQTDEFVGMLGFSPRAADLPGHVDPKGEELELSYVLRRNAWGSGLAFEASTAILRAAAEELPDQPVLVTTQTANHRARKLAGRLGFEEVSTFQAYEAEQTLAVTSLHSFRGPDPG